MFKPICQIYRFEGMLQSVFLLFESSGYWTNDQLCFKDMTQCIYMQFGKNNNERSYSKAYLHIFSLFSNYVLRLDESEGIWDLGGFSPKLVLVLLLAWVLCFFSLKNGVKSSGKVRVSKVKNKLYYWFFFYEVRPTRFKFNRIVLINLPWKWWWRME